MTLSGVAVSGDENKQSSTRAAWAEKREKLTPSGVNVAPRGYGFPAAAGLSISCIEFLFIWPEPASLKGGGPEAGNARPKAGYEIMAIAVRTCSPVYRQ